MKTLTYDGETHTIREWSVIRGIKYRTLRGRLRQGYGLELALNPARYVKALRSGRYIKKGYVMIRRPIVNWSARKGGYMREHMAIAERALGKRLPPKAHVHHVDENPSNNANSNLVICQSSGYHKLLHWRRRALLEGGNVHAKRCDFCRTWHMGEYRRHRECMRERNRMNRQKRADAVAC